MGLGRLARWGAMVQLLPQCTAASACYRVYVKQRHGAETTSTPIAAATAAAAADGSSYSYILFVLMPSVNKQCLT
jgi:hypothetical protein